jgi:hypothetical protein
MEENSHLHGNPAGHEASDVNVWAVGKFALALIFIILVSLVLLVGLFKLFQAGEETSQVPAIEPAKVFPEPQLQKTPELDLEVLRAEEDKLLKGYAWVDPQKGLVRIPIDQAIDLLAKRGLPSRPQAEMRTFTTGVSEPTESSLGASRPKKEDPNK